MGKISFSIITRGFFALIVVLVILSLLDDGNEALGGGYFYAHDTVRDIHGPQIVIPPFIANFNYDKRFIIVKQLLNGNPSIYYSDLYDYNYPSLHGTFFWIIDKKAEKYYGPLSQEEFTNKCDSLNVGIEFEPQNEKDIII